MKNERACVEGMVGEDVRLEDIEKYIEGCVHLPEDSKSALWLLAWTETNRHERRRAVVELIARTAHDLGA